jgi:hypothetical protein
MSEFEVTCEVHTEEGDEMLASGTGENDASPNVARNSALMKVINDDDVDWESDGDFMVSCYNE